MTTRVRITGAYRRVCPKLLTYCECSMRRPDSGFGEAFCLTLVTNDVELAVKGDEAGINRIGIDLEYLGKAARQAGKDARLSAHTWEDLARISRCVRRAKLFVR